MRKLTHQSLGVMVSAGACVIAGKTGTDVRLLPAAAMVICSAYGALLPDFDTMDSAISRKFPLCILFAPLWFVHFLLSVLALFPGPLKGLLKKVSRLTGHRGFAHDPLAALLLLPLFLYPLSGWLISAGLPQEPVYAGVMGLAVGYLSHLIGDAFFGTIRIADRIRISFTHWKTGSWQETGVCILLAGTDCLLVRQLVSMTMVVF